MSILDGFFSLSEDVNKVNENEPTGSITDLVPELKLTMSDEELLSLSKDWQKKWEPYEKKIRIKQDENEEYWMGKQFTTETAGRALVDNLIFESLETFLPIATRPKADPVVESDNTEPGNAIADKTRKMIAYVADNLSYNLKLKQVARYWALYRLGVMKVGWSMKENDISCVAVRPQNLILDPDATIEECDYKGYYIGENLTDSASDLVLRFPDKSDIIKAKVSDMMGSMVPYVMWSTDDYTFWTLGNEILGKIKNPHWNYDQDKPFGLDEFGEPQVDETGQPLTDTVEGNNHFTSRKKPYIFLSIFNVGKHPHDDTNLIEQSLAMQDLVNKRLAQMDKNADNANGGVAVSGDAFTEEQAEKIASTRRKGGTLWIPSGRVEAAVMDLPGHPLPNFVYETLNDYRSELGNIFGVRGSSGRGLSSQRTVRGMQILKQVDSDRIGEGISSYLEEFSDRVFNWYVQLMYVYYDEPHMATVLGKERAKEYIQLVNTEFTTELSVGVKDGSMIPHDPMAKRVEAVELWKSKGIDPITFFDRLEFPNPRESAKLLYQWNANPIALFPDLQAEQQEQQAQLQAQQQQEQQGAQASQAAQAEAAAETQRQHELDKIQLAAAAKQP